MVGKIGYLVQGASVEHRRGNELLIWHITGGTAAGLITGAVVAVAATILRGRTAVPVVAILVLVSMAMLDLGLVRTRWRLPERQTPGYLTCALGDRAGVFDWGLELGSIVTTRPPLYAVLAVPMLALASGTVSGAVLSMCAYGMGRTGAVAAAVQRGSASPDGKCTAIAQSKNARFVAAGILALALASLIGLQLALERWR
jgi:hypothetical protein